VRVRKQAINDLPEGQWIAVFEEGIDLFGGRGQSDQIEVCASDHLSTPGFAIRFEPGRFEVVEDESVGWCSAPGVIDDVGERGSEQRLCRPQGWLACLCDHG
jgi:hypothetical protein